MKKTYKSPTVTVIDVATEKILISSNSVKSNDSNSLIDDLEFDIKGNNKVSDRSEVW